MDVLSKFLLSPITPNRGELEACLIFANCSSQQREMREGVFFSIFLPSLSSCLEVFPAGRLAQTNVPISGLVSFLASQDRSRMKEREGRKVRERGKKKKGKKEKERGPHLRLTFTAHIEGGGRLLRKPVLAVGW